MPFRKRNAYGRNYKTVSPALKKKLHEPHTGIDAKIMDPEFDDIESGEYEARGAYSGRSDHWE